jgi:hypothetical protein
MVKIALIQKIKQTIMVKISLCAGKPIKSIKFFGKMIENANHIYAFFMVKLWKNLNLLSH